MSQSLDCQDDKAAAVSGAYWEYTDYNRKEFLFWLGFSVGGQTPDFI